MSKKIAWLIHAWQPYLNAGSETMTTSLAKALQNTGHTVKIFCTNTPQGAKQWTFSGIKATTHTTIESGEAALKRWKPDVIVSHHECAPRAVQLAKKLEAASVVLLHNTFWMSKKLLLEHPDLAVANAPWVADSLPMSEAKQHMVLRPPVWAEDHRTERDRPQFITHVNLFRNKGSAVFWYVARVLKNHQFMAVKGGYGHQDIRRLPNVTIVDNTTDMRDIWAHTRVFMMPSRYESYGMAAVEALASGIPVVASQTPGLKYSLGSGGVLLPPRAFGSWVQEIKKLDNPVAYERAEQKAQKRSQELDPTEDMARWVAAIEGL